MMGSRDVTALLGAAGEAAGREDWNAAVTALRAANEQLGSQAPTQLRRNLAVCLANRAGKTANEAMSSINMAATLSTEDHRKGIDRRVDDFLKQRSTKRPLLLLGVTFVLLFGLFFGLSFTESVKELDVAPLKGTWARVFEAGALTLVFVWPAAGGLAALAVWFKKNFTLSSILGRTSPCAVCGSDASYRMQLDRHGETSLCGQHARELESIMNTLPAAPGARLLLESAKADLEEAAAIEPSLDGVQANLREVREVLSRLAPEPRGGRRWWRRRPRARSGSRGAVNINTAPQSALASVPGIGPSLAARILADRSINGPYRRVDHLSRVSGIGPAKLAQLRPFLTT